MARRVGSDLLLTLAEAGWFLQLSEHTARRLCAQGRLPGERPGRNWQVRASQLEPLPVAVARRRLSSPSGTATAVITSPATGCRGHR